MQGDPMGENAVGYSFLIGRAAPQDFKKVNGRKATPQRGQYQPKRRRRRATQRPTKPVVNRASAPGSGTGAGSRYENR